MGGGWLGLWYNCRIESLQVLLTFDFLLWTLTLTWIVTIVNSGLIVVFIVSATAFYQTNPAVNCGLRAGKK